MTSSALTSLLSRQPFRPFYLWLSGAAQVYVGDPEKILHKPGDTIAVVTNSDGGESTVDLNLVPMIVSHPIAAERTGAP